MDLQNAWKITKGEPSIRIAIIDGLLDVRHSSIAHLRSRVRTEDTCYRGDSESCIHGTFITSIIFGDHTVGAPKGISPQCTAIIVPLFKSCHAVARARQVDLANAIRHALDHGAHIINISAAEVFDGYTSSADLFDSISECARRRVAIVSSVGNQGRNIDTIPSLVDDVLAVGAHDGLGKPLRNSNWGQRARMNGIVAAGEGIVGAKAGSIVDISRYSGTSAATAIVSGSLGLLLSLQIRLGLPVNPYKARDLLLTTSDKCVSGRCLESHQLLAGTLNFGKAWRKLLGESRSVMKNNALPSSSLPSTDLTPQTDEGIDSSHCTDDVTESGDLSPSACGAGKCSCANEVEPPKNDRRLKHVYAGGTKHQPAIAFGRIGFDFDSLAKKDSLAYRFVPVDSPASLAAFLTAGGSLDPVAEEIVWTVVGDNDVPVCAIQPTGTFSDDAYVRIVEFFVDQETAAAKCRGDTHVGNPSNDSETEPTKREQEGESGDNPITDNEEEPECEEPYVIIPGLLVGTATLARAGIMVPVLRPVVNAMGNSDISSIVDAALKHLYAENRKFKQVQSGSSPLTTTALRDWSLTVSGGLLSTVGDRVTGLAVTPSERAIRFISYSIAVFFSALDPTILANFDVEGVEAHQSATMPVDRDYQDVVIKLIHRDDLTIPATQATFVVDVTDVVPRFVEVKSVRRVRF